MFTVIVVIDIVRGLVVPVRFFTHIMQSNSIEGATVQITPQLYAATDYAREKRERKTTE